jgi:hypothetical protein
VYYQRVVCGRAGERLRLSTLKDRFMSDETTGTQDFVRIPIFQRILDNPFILLFVGVVVPAVFYIIWGIMEFN